MSPFDPDAYLAGRQSDDSETPPSTFGGGNFDPDKYLGLQPSEPSAAPAAQFDPDSYLKKEAPPPSAGNVGQGKPDTPTPPENGAEIRKQEAADTEQET